MRLLHWHTPAELRVDFASLGKDSSKRKGFRREIREASKFFRKLFPFLPEEERPLSEQRNGVWISADPANAGQKWSTRKRRGDTNNY